MIHDGVLLMMTAIDERRASFLVVVSVDDRPCFLSLALLELEQTVFDVVGGPEVFELNRSADVPFKRVEFQFSRNFNAFRTVGHNGCGDGAFQVEKGRGRFVYDAPSGDVAVYFVRREEQIVVAALFSGETVRRGKNCRLGRLFTDGESCILHRRS